jgi:hypothetical protein
MKNNPTGMSLVSKSIKLLGFLGAALPTCTGFTLNGVSVSQARTAIASPVSGESSSSCSIDIVATSNPTVTCTCNSFSPIEIGTVVAQTAGACSAFIER